MIGWVQAITVVRSNDLNATCNRRFKIKPTMYHECEMNREQEGPMSMKEMMNQEYGKDNPRRMTKEGWWLRIVGGGIVLVLSIVLSVVFVITSLQLWWYRALGLTPQILIIAIVAVFVGGVTWCYVAGLRELIRTRRDGTLIVLDSEDDDIVWNEASVHEQIRKALTGGGTGSSPQSDPPAEVTADENELKNKAIRE